MGKLINNDTYRFGGNRELAIQRDGERCVSCGMTRADHKAKFGRDITVDHTDGQGRYTPKTEQNNNLDNLQSLCLPCHGKKDSARRAGSKLSLNKAINIRHIGRELTNVKIAALYGVSAMTISKVKRGKLWKT